MRCHHIDKWYQSAAGHTFCPIHTMSVIRALNCAMGPMTVAPKTAGSVDDYVLCVCVCVCWGGDPRFADAVLITCKTHTHTQRTRITVPYTRLVSAPNHNSVAPFAETGPINATRRFVFIGIGFVRSYVRECFVHMFSRHYPPAGRRTTGHVIKAIKSCSRITYVSIIISIYS